MCAHAVRVAVQRIEGVENVEVSLNQGLATVRLTPGNRVTIDQIRDAIRRNGFTPRGAEVRIRGQVTEQGGQFKLTLPQQAQSYALVEHPANPGATRSLHAAIGKTVLLDGTVPQAAKGEPAEVLQVRGLFAVPPP